MLRGLYSATTGMLAQQNNLDLISNNLANVNTMGFKKSRAGFQDLLYSTIREPNKMTNKGILPNRLQVGNGVKLSSTVNVFTQGNFTQTDNRLDIAIGGEGFLRVQLPDGKEAYTRDGSLKIDEQGYLVTSDGFYVVQPEIKIPQGSKEIAISKEGAVSAIIPGQKEPQLVGQIMLVNFINPDGLEQQGKNFYLETVNSGKPEIGIPTTNGLGTINQGVLETSNVDVAEEMVNMMIAQKAYEFGSKSIQNSDQMLAIANNLRSNS